MAKMKASSELCACTKCGKKYTTIRRLENHRCNYCTVCQRIFSSFQKLETHKNKCVSERSSKGQKFITNEISGTIHGHERCDAIPNNEIESNSFEDNDTVMLGAVIQARDHSCGDLQTTSRTLLQNGGCDLSLTVSNLIGHHGTLIPDDVIEQAVAIMRNHYPHLKAYIGQVTPAEMQVALKEGYILELPHDKQCINFHHVNGHWLTSSYDPKYNQVCVYDSLTSSSRVDELLPQLKLIYGLNCTITYIPITQQSETSCGAYAVASAFSCLLNIRPESQKYNDARMRQHLRRCLEQKQVLAFPTERLDLMSSYFVSQALLQSTVSLTVEMSWRAQQRVDRKKYLLEYKQKQRRDSSFKQKEAEYNVRRRESAEFKKAKQEINRKRRANSSFKDFEHLVNKRRMDPNFKQNLTRRQTEVNQKRRKSPECEKFEHNLSRKSRLNPNYKLNEQNMNKRRRLDPEYQKFGKEIDPKTRKTPECEKFEHNLSRKSRLDPNYKLNEQNMNKRRRLDPDYQKFGKVRSRLPEIWKRNRSKDKENS